MGRYDDAIRSADHDANRQQASAQKVRDVASRQVRSLGASFAAEGREVAAALQRAGVPASGFLTDAVGHRTKLLRGWTFNSCLYLRKDGTWLTRVKRAYKPHEYQESVLDVATEVTWREDGVPVLSSAPFEALLAPDERSVAEGLIIATNQPGVGVLGNDLRYYSLTRYGDPHSTIEVPLQDQLAIYVREVSQAR